MRSTVGFLAACLLAALAPFSPRRGEVPSNAPFPGWPTSWEGRALLPRAASPAETAFAKQFPGKVAAFDDGQRHLLLRYVTQPTRRLHPASDCYRGAGYATHARALRVDEAGRRWGCFEAQRGMARFEVCESIRDTHGQSWSDVSSWYWATAFRESTGPWWAITIAEPVSGT